MAGVSVQAEATDELLVLLDSQGNEVPANLLASSDL